MPGAAEAATRVGDNVEMDRVCREALQKGTEARYKVENSEVLKAMGGQNNAPPMSLLHLGGFNDTSGREAQYVSQLQRISEYCKIEGCCGNVSERVVLKNQNLLATLRNNL